MTAVSICPSGGLGVGAQRIGVDARVPPHLGAEHAGGHPCPGLAAPQGILQVTWWWGNLLTIPDPDSHYILAMPTYQGWR